MNQEQSERAKQLLESCARAQDARDAAKKGAQAKVSEVQAQEQAKVEPLEEQLANAREEIETFVREENSGEKVKIKDLGTAYISRRRQVQIVDSDAFVAAWGEAHGGDTDDLYETKLSPKLCKEVAIGRIEQFGEILPGVSEEQVETLNLKFGT